MARGRSLNVKIRPHGTGFQARPSVNGKQISIIRDTVKEVEAELAKLYLNKDTQISSNITLGEFIASWLVKERDRVAIGKIGVNTFKTRQNALSKHVIPAIGHVRLSALTRDIIRDWSEQGEKHLRSDQNPRGAGYGTRSFQLGFESLHALLGCAVDDGLISANPATKVGKRKLKPSHQKGDIDILEPAELEALYDASLDVETVPAYVYPLIFLASNTGLRQGELFCLRVCDFDFNARILNVRRHLVANLERELVAQPGTKGSSNGVIKKRVVLVPDEPNERMARWCEGKEPDDLVFPNTRGGFLDASNFMEDHFRPLLDAAGVKSVTFHSLRHTHVSDLISDGVNILAIAERIGHSKPQMTIDTYAHLLPKDQAKCVDAVNKRLAASRRGRLRAITSVG